MIPCKNCQQDTTTKNGFVRNKQRYKCQACGYNFVLGDARHKRSTELKKALSIILYSLGKSSFGFLRQTLWRVTDHNLLLDSTSGRHD